MFLVKCQYGRCQEDATTKGFVFVLEEGKNVPVDVVACDKHSEVNSFFKSSEK